MNTCMYTVHPSPALPSLLKATAAAQEQSWQHQHPELIQAFSPAHNVAHTLKGLCHLQSMIHAQGYQQVLWNVESIRWRIPQNVSDKTNHHKTVKTKKVGNHSRGKNCGLYTDAILSSTLNSFLFICLLQCNPIPLFSAASKSGCFLMMPGYQIWITVRTQDRLFVLLLMLGSQNCAGNQGLASESHLTTVNCYSVQMFLGRRGFKKSNNSNKKNKSEKHWGHSGIMSTKKA